MGLVNGALQVGRSALLAYQSALQVIGQNVTNAGTPSYVRQTPVLSPYVGVALPEGFMPGGGLTLSNLKREVDSSLENRLRVATGNQASVLARQQTLNRIESVLNELSDTDLSTLFQSFFSAFGELQNTPHDEGVRGMVLASAESLVSEIKRQREDVLRMRDELNVELGSLARQVDRIASQIAELNVQITALESPGSGGASALRDQRDALLRELGELVQIQVREQPDNSINVYIGNDLFIAGGVNRGVTSDLVTTDNEPRVVVRFADNRQAVNLPGGRMAGIVTARDTDVMGHIQALNGLSAAIINEVNKVHAAGQGLTGYTSLTGAFDVDDPAAVLTAAGLALTPRNGSFVIHVTNTQALPPTRVPTTITVDLDGVGTDDSLATLVAKINAVGNVSAEVTTDNRLRISAASGHEITFGEDSSNVLAALGINVFFTGSNSSDLGINADLMSNLDLIAASRAHEAGDGGNAGSIAALANLSLASLGRQSLLDYYNALASNVAVRGASARAGADSADAIVQALTAQRESLSGVSLDEEAISLMRFERAFQAAARYTTTVNQLMQEVLSLVR
ncbi:MAG TPA: flagellar hook-associated protein FlgK [Phycisphaerae bacterium]|nr:flagellar hook-associated protein FlgK [Phycisphaerae bacterium]